MSNAKRGTSTDDEDDSAAAVLAEASNVTRVAQRQKQRHKRHKHKKHKRKKTSGHGDEVGETGEQRREVSEVAADVDESAREEEEDEDEDADEGPEEEHPVNVAESERSGKSSRARGRKRDRKSGGGGSGFVEGLFRSTGVIGGTTSSPRVSAKRKMGKSGRGRESATSSEEERWLDAIESGKLEEVDDELKKMKPKDPKLMTARQRAMLERKTDAEPNPGVERLVSLPTGYKEKVMTAEAIEKAALKSLKRKQLADEKREKDKKKTMERLLKKQESRASKLVGKGRAWKRQAPLVTYRLTAEGSLISFPPGHDFPLEPAVSVNEMGKRSETGTKVAARLCVITGCGNPRRYSCAKTGVSLCSLECYEANLAAILT